MKTDSDMFYEWMGEGNGFSFKNALKTIRKRGVKDGLAQGIRSSRVCKFFDTTKSLMREIDNTRWLSLKTQEEPLNCFLCITGHEDRDHLFFLLLFYSLWDFITHFGRSNARLTAIFWDEGDRQEFSTILVLSFAHMSGEMEKTLRFKLMKLKEELYVM